MSDWGCVVVCVCVEMIDFRESDVMINLVKMCIN